MVSNSAPFSFIYVYLHFIIEATLSLYILGHITSLYGQGMGKELSQRDKGCPGCPRYRRGLGALKDKQAQMAKEVKQALKEKASAEAGLKTTERQAEDLRKELHYCEINLATEKQVVKDLREELDKAKEAAQLLKEAAEAEK